MPRPRRTEHCWPVAHSLDDLLDVIPDPATYNPEEGVFIQRFMLEPVRNQFIRAIADRFEAAGWGVIYLVNNNWRGQEILEVIPNAQTICAAKNRQKRVEIAKEGNQEVGLKSLVMTETVRPLDESFLTLPTAVRSLEPIRCAVCSRDTFLSWCHSSGPSWICDHGGNRNRFKRDAGLPQQNGNNVRNRTHRPWSYKEEELARNLREQGLTWKQVGEQISRSEAAVKIFLLNGGMAGTAARQKARALLKDDF